MLAFGHRPWYVGIADAICKPCQQAFEGILFENKVDIVLTGHDHVFSRSVPMFNSEFERQGANGRDWAG